MIAAMFDRDGTLSANGGYCHPDDFELLPSATEAISLLNEANVPVIVVSNQTGVRDGRFSEADLRRGTQRLLDELATGGAHIDAFFFGTNKQIKKPNPTIIHEAVKTLGCDIASSYMVGDNGAADIACGHHAGCKTILVRTGWGDSSLKEYRSQWSDVDPNHIVNDVYDAAKLIYASVPEQKWKATRQPILKVF